MSYAVFILTTTYALLGLARGVGGLFGVTQFPILEGIQFSLAAMALMGSILLLGAIALIFISGYIALTAWHSSSKMPMLLRLTAAFLLGLVIFTLAAPLGALIPIPVLPIIIVTAAFWVILKKISEGSQSGSAGGGVSVAQAETIGLQALRTRMPNITLSATGAQMDANKWKLSFLGSDGKTYQATVDPHTGTIHSWGQTNV
jgi:hypothetical protein